MDNEEVEKIKDSSEEKEEPKYRYRSAVTGELMSKEEFDNTPKEHTVRERIN